MCVCVCVCVHVCMYICLYSPVPVECVLVYVNACDPCVYLSVCILLYTVCVYTCLCVLIYYFHQNRHWQSSQIHFMCQHLS